MRGDCKYILFSIDSSVRVMCRVEALVRLGELQRIMWRWSPAADQILHKANCRRMRGRKYGNEKLQFLHLQGRYIDLPRIQLLYTYRHRNHNITIQDTYTQPRSMDIRRCLISLFISLCFCSALYEFVQSALRLYMLQTHEICIWTLI